MQHLFWKFWLAVSFVIVSMLTLGVFVVTQWQQFEQHAETRLRPNISLHTVADRLEGALQRNENPATILLDNEMTTYGQTFLIDPHGADWLNRPIPAEILGSEPATQTATAHSADATPTPSIFARAIRADGSRQHFMIFQFDNSAQPLWDLFQRFGVGWILLGSLVISGLISALLAYYIANPLQQLALVSKRQGKGELKTEIDESLLLRHDEIGALARQLKTSAAQTAEALQRQKDLIRDVSHEVRTPLARLQLASEQLEATPADNRALTQIQKEVGNIDDLVQGLLHLSRSSNYDGHTATLICLADLLNDCVQQAQILAAHKQVTLTATLSPDVGAIQGDPATLKQVFDNLLTNAIRHTPAGTRVELTCQQHPNGYTITVSDAGPGVPATSLESIFEPFVRLDNARQRDTGGFGIGLTLVKKIVNRHGGKVWAENGAPHGLAVKVTLPAPQDRGENGAQDGQRHKLQEAQHA